MRIGFNADKAAVDRTVDQIDPGQQTQLIQTQPCLKIVHRADHNSVLTGRFGRQRVTNVSGNRLDNAIGIQFRRASGYCLRLGLTDIRFA